LRIDVVGAPRKPPQGRKAQGLRLTLPRLRAAILALLAAAWCLPAAGQGLIRDAEIERTLARMSDPIFAAAGLPRNSVEIYIVNDPSLNAFVAGGRRMFLHTGLLTELETPAEVTGVIAHEAGHIAGGHLARRSINLRNAQGPALVGLLAGIAIGALGGGEAGAAIAAGAQGAVTRELLRYNRGEEGAADQAAVRYLTEAGVDPTGLLKVLQRFRGQEVFTLGNQDPYVRTHPLSTRRMELLERRVAASRAEGAEPSEERVYWFRRMQAKLRGFLGRPERVLADLEGRAETEHTLYARAVALHRLPRPEESLAAVDRLLAKRPDDPFYLELKGQLLFETGRPSEAVPYYRRAVAEAPGEPLLKAGLGRALLALGTAEANAEALEVLEAARQADPGDAAGLRSLATAYSRAGRQGMATLATAERYALIGRTEDAVLHAGRAASILPEGSPGWLRAQDILAMKRS